MTAAFVHDWDELSAKREAWRALTGPARFLETYNLIGAAWQFYVRHWGEITTWVEE